jgi:hypothetical protein
MKLQIEVFNPKGDTIKKIIAGHIDASRNMTIISESTAYIPGKEYVNHSDYYICDKLDHFNIFQGLITLYYKSGAFVEISKV